MGQFRFLLSRTSDLIRQFKFIRPIVVYKSIYTLMIILTFSAHMVAKASDNVRNNQVELIDNASDGNKKYNAGELFIDHIDPASIKLEIEIPKDGRVVLPEGTSIEHLRALGDDIIITDTDGRYIVIRGGAKDIPTLFVDKIEIPIGVLQAFLDSSDINVASGFDSEITHATIKVFYATDRARTGSDKADKFYGGSRGLMEYGTTDVSIPRDHRMGSLESPSILKLEFYEDPDRHVVLLNVKPEEKSKFFDLLRGRRNNSDSSNAFVFIHGYNVTFEDAARRTAQMAYDLGFDGSPIFYSWPSQGSESRYIVDETNSAWSASNIREFLMDVAKSVSENDIYLIAHSMGTRPVTKSLAEIAAIAPDLRQRFKEVILAAPDIDADVFARDIAPKIVAKNTGVTLYLSNNDKALLASKKFHGYPRIGDARDGIRVSPDIDFVDASELDADFIGHSYYGDNNSILSDLFYLLRERKRPAERFGLEKMGVSPRTYWRLKSQ